MVCLLDPKTIVFGGSVSNYNPDFIELVKEELAELLHHEQKHILEHIQASTIKGDNGIIGAVPRCRMAKDENALGLSSVFYLCYIITMIYHFVEKFC